MTFLYYLCREKVPFPLFSAARLPQAALSLLGFLMVASHGGFFYDYSLRMDRPLPFQQLSMWEPPTLSRGRGGEMVL